MNISVYTLPNCSSCSHMRELMSRANQTYEEISIGTDITYEDFKQKFPGIEALPYVVINDEPVGGLVEVALKFLKEKLVTPPEK